MLPIISYEMVRQRNEERRERSIKRFWWRYAPVEELPAFDSAGADVIEVAFGTHCGMEEPLGA